MKREKRVASLKSPSSIALLLVSALLLACGEHSLHSYQSVGGEWPRGRSLAFVHDSALCRGTDSLALYVGVRYNTAYKYRNLCILLKLAILFLNCCSRSRIVTTSTKMILLH